MNNNAPGTSSQFANVNPSLQPRNMRLSSGGASNVPTSRRFPQIRGGQCEHCGTLDPRQPGNLQYKLCPHYRGMEMKCIYCPLGKDQEEVVRNNTLNVFEHPHRPGEIISLCKSFECTQRFEQEFGIRR